MVQARIMYTRIQQTKNHHQKKLNNPTTFSKPKKQKILTIRSCNGVFNRLRLRKKIINIPT